MASALLQGLSRQPLQGESKDAQVLPTKHTQATVAMGSEHRVGSNSGTTKLLCEPGGLHLPGPQLSHTWNRLVSTTVEH